MVSHVIPVSPHANVASVVISSTLASDYRIVGVVGVLG